MLISIVLTSLLMASQANPLPGNDEFAESLRNRPPRPGDQAQPTNPSSVWHEQCLDQLEEDPSRAHTQAQIRRNESFGLDRVLANHCLGLAATDLQLWGDAQAAFAAARDETPEEELRTRARFGAMAGNAAMQGGDFDLALSLLTRAETDADAASAGTLAALAAIDRARILVALEQPDEALSALTKATGLLPQSAEAWLYKATLLRRLNRLGEAQPAIGEAIDAAPMDPQVRLEAGVIAVLDGRDEAARGHWQQIVDALPSSDEAETARGYLAQLGPAPEADNAVEPSS